MIAQEIVSAIDPFPVLCCCCLVVFKKLMFHQAYLIPTRLNSLILLSTAARIVNTVGWVENLRSRINLFIPKDIDTQLKFAKPLLYSTEYIHSPDNSEYIVQPFPTNVREIRVSLID